MTRMMTMTATRPDDRHPVNRAALRWRLAVLLPGLLALGGVLHAETVAFIGVNVVPMDREVVLSDQTVLVEDETIRTIGPRGSVTVPAGARAIDAGGQYLLPGLAEMHAHIPGRRQREGWVEEVLFLYVAKGVTTARGMLGAPCHLELRAQVANHEILGPRIFTSGPSLNGNSVDGVEQARNMVAEQAGSGYDFLKLHPGLSVDEYQAIATTAAELEIPFAGHVPEDVGLSMAFASCSGHDRASGRLYAGPVATRVGYDGRRRFFWSRSGRTGGSQPDPSAGPGDPAKRASGMCPRYR